MVIYMDKKNKKVCKPLNYGFWLMLAFFILLVLFSSLFTISGSNWLQWASLISGLVFIILVFFVFISSLLTIAPEGKGMAYVALAVAIIFILYILLSSTIGTIGATSVLG